jgi:prepilin-type N-terminal cleavage/methylation domain-containing protein
MQKGFTLIELILVIGIVTTLAAIVIIAVNPKKQFDQVKARQALFGASAIANALQQCYVNHGGNWAKANGSCYSTVAGATLTEALDGNTPVTPLTIIGKSTAYPTFYVIDLCPLITSGYLTQLPVDPNNNPIASGRTQIDCSTLALSNYNGYILKMVNNVITVSIGAGNFYFDTYTGPTSIVK